MERCVNRNCWTTAAADPRAVRSRKDLQRVNAWMGHCRDHGPGAALDLPRTNGPAHRRAGRRGWQLPVARGAAAGAGLAGHERGAAGPPEHCRPRKPAGASRPWAGGTEMLEAEALAWLERPAAPACDAMLANLFLHHFSEGQLAGLLRAAARQTRVFIAVEPRRSRRSLFFSRWLWLIGCNDVTRHDAPVSVRAGFAGRELSRLWPADQGWTLQERPGRLVQSSVHRAAKGIGHAGD